jgi:hypothetical protein
MRRKLTALMALLTLAVTGAIAPTAAAEELEAEYIAGMKSDGTFLEGISVSGATAEDCKSSTYQPLYDESDGTCTVGYQYKPEKLYGALSIQLTPLGDNKYSFRFTALSFSSLKSEAESLFSGRTLNFTSISLGMPKGTTFSSGVEKATNDSNDKYDIYRWDDVSTSIYVKGTTTLDASAAQYITGNSDPSESESPTPTPTTESATPSATSESATPSATANALASNKSDSNTALYIGIGVAVVVLAASAITAIVLVNKKKQPTGPTYPGPYPGAYPGGPGGPGAGFGPTGPGAGPGAGSAMGAGAMGGPRPAGASGTGFGAPQGGYPGGYQPQPSSGQPQPSQGQPPSGQQQPYQPPSAPSAPSNQAPYNPGNQPPSAPYGPGNGTGANH